MELKLVLQDDVILQYAAVGDIEGSVSCEVNSIPDDFYEKFRSSFYLLKNDEIVENPDYVEPAQPEFGPSEQDKVNAQVLLKMAQQQQKQDTFNAQILLQIAKLGGTTNV